MKPFFLSPLLFSFLCLACLVIPLQADDKELGKLFVEAKCVGTVVIASLDGKRKYVWNEKRAKRRYTPASTFKVLNTLIALEEGKVKADEVFQWDGVKRFREQWNRDQTLKSAFKESCVWAYQEMAKRVGNEAYLSHLKKLSYGNGKTGDEVTTFWLSGDLKISAWEQIAFLRGVYEESFPYQEANYKILKEAMFVKQTADYTLRAKTGWCLRKKEKVRWYVGYVETRSGVWLFAANVDMPKWRARLVEDEIVMKALNVKGIVPRSVGARLR